MSLKEYIFQDICTSISDGDHLAPPKTDIGIPFITISNITSQNQIDFTDTAFVPEEYYDKLDEKRKAQVGDILYSVVGTFGKPVLVKKYLKFVFQRHIAILRPNNEIVIPAFLYYVMSSKEFYKKADILAIGAAQRTITLTSLRNLKIELPSLQTQQRIASILSRYDDLIENYQQQIKLLEEAAQRLYKEWFVDLHFPGYENTKVVDGVPERWKNGKVEELALFKRGKVITKNEKVDGCIPVVAGGLEPAYYCNKSNTGNRVITISASGANAGFTRFYYEKIWASDCSFVDIDTCNYIHYIYCFLKSNVPLLTNLQKGAAQPHVYAKDVNLLEMFVPSLTVLSAFEERIKKVYDTIANLSSQITFLIEARDRLLPKLMSGEIEV